jgi:predicted RNase H-like nuclease
MMATNAIAHGLWALPASSALILLGQTTYTAQGLFVRSSSRIKGAVTFESPQHALFGQAIEFIEGKSRLHDTCIVAIDQPTIVPNEQGCRPVDRVAGSLVSFLGGGVQPANRSKRGIFDNDAPIWSFKESLGATEDPELSRRAERGLFIIEVFPALALPTFEVL